MREIYEGDILKTDQGLYFIKEALPFIQLCDVKYERDTYWNGDYYQGGDIQVHDWDEFEVIGNIYENPELLEGEKND